MSIFCNNIDKDIKNYKYWELSYTFGPFIDNDIVFYLDKGTIISIKNEYDKLYGIEKTCFISNYHARVIRANIRYVMNGKYMFKIIIQKENLPDIYNYILKVDLNYCTPYLGNDFTKSIKMDLIK
jgi:hypothetical protein